MRSKMYHYLVDNATPSLSANSKFLLELHVNRSASDKVELNVSAGQSVVVMGKSYDLVLLAKTGRLFRVWVRDPVSDNLYSAKAFDVESVSVVPRGSRTQFEADRVKVI